MKTAEHKRRMRRIEWRPANRDLRGMGDNLYLLQNESNAGHIEIKAPGNFRRILLSLNGNDHWRKHRDEEVDDVAKLSRQESCGFKNDREHGYENERSGNQQQIFGGEDSHLQRRFATQKLHHHA